MKLEFTTTAMRRPAIIAQTYESFARNLRGLSLKNCTLFLNIDPDPVTDPSDADLVEQIARETFGEVRVFTPAEANFAGAIKRLWAQPTGVYFFHLEDDWTLNKSASVETLAALLDADPELSSVNLRPYRTSANFSRICLAPGLFRTAHARVMADRMTLDANPEEQLRPTTKANPHGDRHAGFKGRQFPDKPNDILLTDIGRNWMKTAGVKKERDVRFTRWVTA